MKLRSGVLLTVLLCTVAASGAFAATQSGPFNATPISYTKTDWSSTLDFPKFNSALGTLIQVDLYVSAGITTTLTVTNGSTTSSSQGNAMTHELVTVNDPLSLLTLAPEIYTAPFDYNLNPGESVTSPGLTDSASDSSSYTASAILAEFVGPGTISMPTFTFTETVLANTGGNTDASQTTYAEAAGTVTYWYVPEPTSLMALATMMGLAGVVRLRRRR